MSDPSIESSDTPQRLLRSQSATPGHRNDARHKYNEYLKKLEQKNKLLKTNTDEHKTKDNILKQRENGFQLYVNGVHNTLPPRSSSVMRKRLDKPSNRIQTPAPLFSDFLSPTLSNTTRQLNSRRRWIPSTETKIKTEQGSIIADIHDKQVQSDTVNNQLTYRIMTPTNVDQSWMPNWYRNTQSNTDISNFNQSLSLSLDNISTTLPLTKSQQQTYRLSTTVGR